VHDGEAGQRTGGRGAGETVKQVSAPAGEVLQLARGREIGGGGSSLGSYLEGGGPDPTCVHVQALQDALAVLLEEDGGPHHPRAPPSRPRGDDEQSSRHRRCVGDAKAACGGGVKGRRRDARVVDRERGKRTGSWWAQKRAAWARGGGAR
jgi:hypothetical protein